MNLFFVSHSHRMNQIDPHYATISISIGFFFLIFLIILTLKKQHESGEIKGAVELLYVGSGTSLRGGAILLLILGHLFSKCVEGDQFLDQSGKWAVIIFLYISGVAISKTYGFENVRRGFVVKRLRRLYLPFVISLIVFYSLDYLLLSRTYSLQKVVLSFMGVVSTGPPNGPAWFITYIVLLYTLFYVVSKLGYGNLVKMLIVVCASYIVGFVVSSVDILYSKFGIWTQYSIVFPVSVGVGIYNRQFVKLLTLIYSHSRGLYLLIALLFILQYFSGFGNNFVVNLYDTVIYQKIIRSLYVISFLTFLVMLSFLIDKYRFRSYILTFLGENSFEIYLIHMPFMVYYDFLLFRRPLYMYFYFYLIFVICLGVLLRAIASLFDKVIVPPADFLKEK